MKGYKGTDKNMRCRGFQYEIGKTYTLDGKLEMCENGFHFCRNLIDVFDYYDNNGENLFFEIEADEQQLISAGYKYVTSKITIVKQLSTEEVNRAFYGKGHGDGKGYGNGSGNGYGNGNGSGNGYGFGYGYGDGYGNGYGYGYGNGYGYGYGNGYGFGYGDGDGYGYGNGNIQKILNYK